MKNVETPICRFRLLGLCPARVHHGTIRPAIAVRTLLAVIRKIFYFMRVMRTMKRAIDEWKPDVVCTVDYPGMNLKLAAYAKSRGIRAVHVVCPQVWAWKQGRIPKIEASLDRLCCFFPFEPALFRPGFAEFVGHPLAEDGRVERADLKGVEEEGGKLLAVLPGSRMGEIRHHMKTLLESVAELRRDIPGLRVSIPAANERALRAIRGAIGGFGCGDSVEVRLGGARGLRARADAAVVASGTATLEAALAGCPTHGEGEESAFTRQQPIFTVGKPSTKSSLLLEAAITTPVAKIR